MIPFVVDASAPYMRVSPIGDHPVRAMRCGIDTTEQGARGLHGAPGSTTMGSMKRTRSRDEIDRLSELLEAEAAGKPHDRAEILRLTEFLAQSCPEIRSTLGLIQARIAI